MYADIRIRAAGPPQRDLLIRMYDRFDPLGLALGLPPRTAEARREWIERALGHKVNVAAFSPTGGLGSLLPGHRRAKFGGVGDFCPPGISREGRRNGTCKSGARVVRSGRAAARVDHDSSRKQGRFAPAKALSLPPDEVGSSCGRTRDRFARPLDGSRDVSVYAMPVKILCDVIRKHDPAIFFVLVFACTCGCMPSPRSFSSQRLCGSPLPSPVKAILPLIGVLGRPMVSAALITVVMRGRVGLRRSDRLLGSSEKVVLSARGNGSSLHIVYRPFGIN